MKAALILVAAFAVAAPAAADVRPAFDDASIIRIGGKGKHHGKHHGKKHRHHDGGYRQGYRDGRREARREARYYYDDGRRSYDDGYERGYRHWSRGQVLPYEYRRQPIYNYDDYGWGPPPRGHAYYRTDTGDILLAAIATGIIVSIITR